MDTSHRENKTNIKLMMLIALMKIGIETVLRNKDDNIGDILTS